MKYFPRPASLGFASLVLLLCSHFAIAGPTGNLIDPNSWTLYDQSGHLGDAHVQSGDLYFTNSGVFGQVNGQPGIIVNDFRQIINTTPGQAYTYVFDVNADGAGDNRLYFQLSDASNGYALFSGQSIPQESGVPYSFIVTATSLSTYVDFAGGAPNSSLFVTNISAIAAVPEASTLVSTLALLSLGSSYTSLMLLRKRNQHRPTA